MKKIKGYIAAILSIGMVLAGSTTSFAAEHGQKPEEPALIEGTARIIILPDYEDTLRTVTQSGIYLRAEPGLSGRIIKPLDEGTKVYLNGEAEIVDGLTWMRVVQSPYGEGWIAQKYIR